MEQSDLEVRYLKAESLSNLELLCYQGFYPRRTLHQKNSALIYYKKILDSKIERLSFILAVTLVRCTNHQIGC